MSILDAVFLVAFGLLAAIWWVLATSSREGRPASGNQLPPSSAAE